jgi:hypothetical protein
VLAVCAEGAENFEIWAHEVQTKIHNFFLGAGSKNIC